jgi:hypothetical protein
MPRVTLPPGGRIVPVVCSICRVRFELIVEKGRTSVECPNRCQMLAVPVANSG